ncbi:hypothetical protein D3C86_1244340 [compost metagenome]
MHLLHSLRTRRWATTPMVAAETMKPSTPISCRRMMAPGASLVWSEVKTRWPVSADSMAILATSRSRVSPISMMSGSWRRKALRTRAKV